MNVSAAPPRGRAVALFLTVMVLAVVSLFAAPATPALACSPTDPQSCLPTQGGNPLDCLDPPTPAMPDTGVTSFFVSEPPPASSTNVTREVSIYDQYGYAGLTFHTYDLGCGPDGAVAPDALVSTSIANMMFGVATFLVGLTNSAREYAYDPSSMWGWTNGLIASASAALYDRVFSVLGLVAVVAVGVWLMWSARRGDLSDAATTAGWALLVMVVTTAIAAWPLKASSAADATLTGSISVVNSALHPQSTENCGGTVCVDERTPQRAASGVITDIVLYRQWLSGELGSADNATAVKYGDRLYAASTMSWKEAREARSSTSRRTEIVKAKQDDWKAVAAEIKAADPDAYEYLTGKQGSGRVGSAFTALVAALVTLPFDLMASLLIIVAFLIIRLAVAFLPAIAVVGILRPTSGPLRGLFRTVVAAIMNCVIFGVGASVYLLAVELITKTTSLAGWQQILLIWLTGLVLWLLLRPFRRLTSLTGKDPFAELAGGLGGMHRKFFGDMKQLGIAAAGSYLGDVNALEANDEKRAERAAGGQGRPEGWTRQDPAFTKLGDTPPGRVPPTGTPDAQRSPVAARRASDPLVPTPRPGSAPARPENVSGSQYATASDPGALPVETSDVYVIYRPDRGYQTVPTSEPAARSSPRIDQAAANVAAAADAVRDLAAVTASSRRSESSVR